MISYLAKFYAHKIVRNSMRNSLRLASSNFKREPKNKKYMLYAHVPFCHTFCPYCSFHKFYYQSELCKEYFENLRLEMTQIARLGFKFDSLYVGGGATLIDEDELIKTLELAKKLFNIDEISCESDPNHIDAQNLARFKGLINRLSVGVQSFNDEILKKVGRFDKFGGSEVLLEKLSKAIGILPTFSLDLIFNFPFQSELDFREDIKKAKSIGADQYTFYPLMKSPLMRDKIAKSLGVSSKDNEEKFYKIIRESFRDFAKNNAWSFSKKEQNLKDEYIGENNEFVGIGSGAFSFLDGTLFVNAFDLNDYSGLVKCEKSAVIAQCEFDKMQKIKYLFLNELFNGEINIAKFDAKNSCEILKVLRNEILLLKLSGAVKISDGKIITSDFGDYLCVILMKEFYTGMDAIRAFFRDFSSKNKKEMMIKF